jgi:TPR repeat protein
MDKALFWYHKAARKGFSDAKLELGYYYENGIGVPRDETKAVQWYQSAASDGNSNAQYLVGLHIESDTTITDKKDLISCPDMSGTSQD